MAGLRRTVATRTAASRVIPFRGRGRINPEHIEVQALPDGALALWTRVGTHDRFAVSRCVPASSVAAVIAHIRTHASAAVADAMGLVTCERAACDYAQAWLPVLDLGAAKGASSA